jgi:hypothetical protein
MKLVKLALACAAFVSMPVLAAPATEATIKEVLTASHAQKLVEGMTAQFDAMMDDVMQQSLQGRTPNAKQQQAITNMKTKMSALMKDSMTWAKFEPMYIRLYQQTFTEEEVVGMLAFYKTPAGQALIEKLPTLTQNLMREMPAMMADVTPRLRQIQAEFATEMRAASEPEPAAPATQPTPPKE